MTSPASGRKIATARTSRSEKSGFMVRKDLRAAPHITGNNPSAGACYKDNTFIRIRPDATAGRNIFGPKTNTRRDRTYRG